MRRPDLSVGSWLAIGFGATLLCLAALLAAALVLQARIGAAAAHQLELIGPRAAAAAHVESAALHVSITARSFALLPGRERLEAFEQAVRDLDDATARFASVPKDPESDPIAAAALADVRPFVAAAEELVAAAQAADEARMRDDEVRLVGRREALFGHLRSFHALQARDDARSSAGIRADQRSTERWLALAFVVVLVVLVATWLVAIRMVRLPAKRLARTARRVGEGDYAAGAALAGGRDPHAAPPRNELAALTNAFAAMSGALRDREERLAAQAEELQVQQEELQAQNEELKAQEEELQAQNEELQAQQEELHAQNEELQRHAELLRARDARLRELVDALGLADRRKDEFLAVLSHELRNPLAPIVNALAVLERGDPASEPARRAREVIARQVKHLARLVDDLLDIARITQGKIRLRRAPLELGQAVRQAAEDNAFLLSARGVALEVEVPPRGVWVQADPARLAQIVANLLQNAAKFTDGGGAVRVGVEARPDGRAAIRVRDTGIGMTPEVLATVFEPFVQAEGSLARTRGGLGLGLALVRGLVELHGGTVRAASDGAGRGSEFVVELPLETPPQAPAIAFSSPASAPRRVLVIEDNADAAETLRDLLVLAGHEAEVALDAREGLEKALRSPPDAILCDLGLPDVDGYALARRVRAEPALASVFLVALSGYALPDDLARAEQAGFDAHLAKPAPLEAIEALLSQPRLARG